MHNGHPWQELEPKLQRIRELVLAGEGRRSPDLSELVGEVHPFVVASASRICRSPRFRYLERDSNLIAQRWWVKVIEVAFKRYDVSQGPLFPYLYTFLARDCQQENRRERIRRGYEIPLGYAGEAKRPEALARKRDSALRVRTAVRKLPKHLRRAVILKYGFGKSSAEAACRCGVRVGTFNGWTYQARTVLRQTLRRDDWLDVA